MKRLNLPKEQEFVGPALIWKRVVAFLIDMVIVNLVVLFPFRGLFRGIVPENYSFGEAYKFLSSDSYSGELALVSVAIAVLIIFYFYLMERKMGQTIGKMLMGIYVVADNNGKSWQFLVRNIVFIPLFPFVLLWILDPLFMFFTKTNQRLSEILSRTKVVEKHTLQQ